MNRNLTADDIIRRFRLEPLEGEGGYFRRTWFRQAPGQDVPEASCIMYLVTPESFSALHRLAFDEMFHFYLGDPCRSVMIAPDGQVSEVVLGQDIVAGMKVQHLVPAGYWQATSLIGARSWALLGTTMSPGFHESGFELATPDVVCQLEPGWRADILDLIAKHDEDQAELRQEA